MRTSPAYFEARYLRTLEWLAEKSCRSDEYLRLWIFALTDNQLGFALDVNVEFERLFGENGRVAATQGRNLAVHESPPEVFTIAATRLGNAPVSRHLRSGF